MVQVAKTGLTFYLARVKIDDVALAAIGGLKLVRGMPVEAFIETGERAALSYLLKPFTDQVARAYREEQAPSLSPTLAPSAAVGG